MVACYFAFQFWLIYFNPQSPNLVGCESIRFSSLFAAGDVPPRETSPAAKSEEKRMLSQATNLENIKAKCFLEYRQPVYLNETY